MTLIIKCYQHCFLITHSVKFHYAIQMIYMLLSAPCGVHIRVFERCPIVISYVSHLKFILNLMHSTHVRTVSITIPFLVINAVSLCN